MRTRLWARRPIALAAALALAAILPACGGGSSTPPTPVTTQPPAPVRSLVIQGSFNFSSSDILRHEFTTSGTGTLEINADWTFATSRLAIGVLRGSCSFDQIIAGSCAEVGANFPAPKPMRLTINNVAAGTYTFVIVNPDNRAESGNYQVYLTR